MILPDARQFVFVSDRYHLRVNGFRNASCIDTPAAMLFFADKLARVRAISRLNQAVQRYIKVAKSWLVEKKLEKHVRRRAGVN